jgi:hypothetical protein
VRELKLEAALGNKQLEGSHPQSYMRRFMSQLSMTNKEFKWGEDLCKALLPQVGGRRQAGSGGPPGKQRRPAAQAQHAKLADRGCVCVGKLGAHPLACLPNRLLQEGPEANVHTPWHGKSPTSIAGTVVYIIANLPGKTRVPLPDICRTCGVADGTIRQIYREIHPHLKALIDKAGAFATHADVDALPQPAEPAK